MPITVGFRGPFLFITRGQEIDEVLMPNAETHVIYHGSYPWRHADNSGAKQHFARLAVLDGSGTKVVSRTSLVGRIVTVEEDTVGSCTKGKDFDAMVPLDEVTNNNNPKRDLTLRPSGGDYWTYVAASIRFASGTIGTDTATNSYLPWDMPEDFHPGHGHKQKHLPLRAAWQSATKAATIRVTDTAGALVQEIQLVDGDVVIIYNYDSERPEPPELNKPEQCDKPGKPLEDKDFKWLYQLLVPPGGQTLEDWLNGKRLPAPCSTCAPYPKQPGPLGEGTGAGGEPYPDLSTCFFGRWSL